jgi:hypothetical protein
MRPHRSNTGNLKVGGFISVLGPWDFTILSLFPKEKKTPAYLREGQKLSYYNWIKHRQDAY